MTSTDDKIITTRLSHTRSLAGAFTTIVICLVLLPFISQMFGGSRYIESVKQGHSSAFPNITYEDAYNKFYSNPKWRYYKSTTGADVISFTGQCTYDGRPTTVELQYILNKDNTFQLAGGSINGIEQNVFVLAQLSVQPFIDY